MVKNSSENRERWGEEPFFSPMAQRGRKEKNMSLDLNYRAEEVVDTDPLSNEEWLEYRRKGIGGSDAAAVMGQSIFTTRRDLYYDKIGVPPRMEEEQRAWVQFEVGHRLEELVAKIFSKKTGLEVFPIRKMFRHPLYPFMLADVDYFIRFPDGEIGILECKTTNYNSRDKWENGAVPVYYEYQCRHYMAVMNVKKLYIACLYGNSENDFVYRYMERDLEAEEDLIAEEEYFWKEYVEKRQEPDYTERAELVLESIRRHCGPADPDADKIRLKGSYQAELDRFLFLKEEKAKAEAEVKRLESEMKSVYAGIVEEMGVSCQAVLSTAEDSYEISYKPVYRTGIDKEGLERLKIQHPDVYDDYVKVSESRRFSVRKGRVA